MAVLGYLIIIRYAGREPGLTRLLRLVDDEDGWNAKLRSPRRHLSHGTLFYGRLGAVSRS